MKGSTPEIVRLLGVPGRDLGVFGRDRGVSAAVGVFGRERDAYGSVGVLGRERDGDWLGRKVLGGGVGGRGRSASGGFVT